jgi:hypothetical protein
MRIQNKIILSFAMALMIPSTATAQVGSVPARSTPTGLATTLQVAGKPCQFAGKAECQHAPVAFIYGVRAEMWSVRQSNRGQSITLTLWRPKNGSGDMFTLSVATGGKTHRIDTVKVPGKNSTLGSGKVTLATPGAGGKFTIHATAEDGAAITGTIDCSAFGALIAEGG